LKTTKKQDARKSRFIHTTTIEKLDLKELFVLKTTANTYYVTIKPNTVKAYDLLPGDLLKMHLIEARKTREQSDEKEGKEWEEEP
jgi:hypothetical protein